MSDMRLNTTHNITNDAKNRNLMDAVAAEMSNSQFLDVMMTRITAMRSDDAELNALVKKVDGNKGTDAAANKALLNRLKDLQKNKDAQESGYVAQKSEIRHKVKERIQKIAENHTSRVVDTQPLEALQKTAQALLEANEQGDIALPAAIVDKLQAFLAKGDDFKAFDMANFLTEFNDLFRQAILIMPNNQAGNQVNIQAEPEFQWPQDVVDAFQSAGLELDMNSGDMMTVMRALKALVNAGQNAAIATLDAQAQQNIGEHDAVKDALSALIGDEILPMTEQLPEALAAIKPDKTQTAHQAASPADTTNPANSDAILAKLAKKDNAAPSLTEIAKDAAFPQEENLSQEDNARRDSRSDKRDANGQTVATQNKQTVLAQNSMAQEVKTSFANAVQQNASIQPAAITQAAIDPTLIGIDQGGVSSANAARAAASVEMLAADRSRPNPVSQQVMMQIAAKGNKATQISVQLSPADLGRVEVRMTIQRDGQTHAVIVADKPETLALLQRDATHLERALQQAGLNTNTGNMSFNLRDERQAQEFNQGRKRFNRSSITDQPVQEASMMIQQDSIISDTRINYHA